MDQRKASRFLEALRALCEKHGVTTLTCGCCHGLSVYPHAREGATRDLGYLDNVAADPGEAGGTWHGEQPGDRPHTLTASVTERAEETPCDGCAAEDTPGCSECGARGTLTGEWPWFRAKQMEA